MALRETTTTSVAALDEATVNAFIASLRGPVIRPSDASYDDERRVQNGLIDRRPGLIVQASGNADVIAAVNLARDHGLLLSVRGGGHNVAGNAVNDGGIVVDLSHMTGIHVDPIARTAHVQGGATWADLDRETQVFGLATPGGVVSTTGVGGLTLHGGMGHLRRKYGLSIDNLRSVDIVTADGELRHASADEHPDLFWAVRGAGSNFGVVTSFEFELHPLGHEVMLCAVGYHLDDARTVLRTWRDLQATMPEEVTTLALFWSVPQGFPPELVGTPVVIFAAVYAGPAEEGERVTMPFRQMATPLLDLSARQPWTAIQSGFDPFFPKGSLYYWKSTYVEALSDELIDALCRLAAERPSPRTTMDIWPQAGAPMRVGASETAFGRRPPFLVAFESSWDDPATNEANIAWAREAYTSMSRFQSSGIYLNFPGFGEEKDDLVRAAYGANYDRLVAIKTTYDPGNLFRMNINIAPNGTRG
jgi:FAD/FMN-containing dehydrogenase